MKKCKKCNEEIPAKIIVEGISKNLATRKFCLKCSPWRSGTRIGTKTKPLVPEDVLRAAVKESFSIIQVFKKINWPTHQGYYYKEFHKKRVELGLDISHFDPFGKTRAVNKPSHETFLSYLIEGSTYSRSSLKKRLIKDGLLEQKCLLCDMSNWMGKSISLHLDHINGICDDNRLENLRLLCPNCHSQTPTYAGRNIKTWAALKECVHDNQERFKTEKAGFVTRCPGCEGFKLAASIRCNSCAKLVPRVRKIEWPAPEDILKMLASSSYLDVGKKLGVSDQAVRKHLTRTIGSYPKPGRGNPSGKASLSIASHQ